MELQIDTQYILDTFRTLVNTPSPVGYYREINPVVAQMAKELGYDAGFGMNTYADDVASFIAQEMARRMHRK